MASGVSPATNRLVNIVVCVGAAVVIFGAWAKILHKSFADIMLTVGLLTEAAIFLIYAILPPPDQGAPSVAVPEVNLERFAGVMSASTNIFSIDFKAGLPLSTSGTATLGAPWSGGGKIA